MKSPTIVNAQHVAGTNTEWEEIRKRAADHPQETGKQNSTEGLDDDDDVVRTIDQKLQMSEQMTELLVNRVSILSSTIMEQRRVMSEDLNPNSTITSGKVHRTGTVNPLSREGKMSTVDTKSSTDEQIDRNMKRLPWSRVITYANLFGEKEPQKGRRQGGRHRQSQIGGDSRRPSTASALTGGDDGTSLHHTSVKFQPPLGSGRESLSSNALLSARGGPKQLYDDASMIFPVQCENKRARKVEYEKELHLLAETHVTRSVENTARLPSTSPSTVSFKARNELHKSEQINEVQASNIVTDNELEPLHDTEVKRMPFDVKPGLLAAYVLTVIQIPPQENIDRTLNMVFQSRTLLRILEVNFWYVHCLCFQKPARPTGPNCQYTAAADKELEFLECTLSALYVKLLSFLRKKVNFAKLDTVYKYLPYAIGHAIIVGFRYLCPGSRHMYTYSFKTKVFRTCCNMLLGIEICDVSLSLMRASLFPSESHNDPLLSSGDGTNTSSGGTSDTNKASTKKNNSTNGNKAGGDENDVDGDTYTLNYPEISETLSKPPEYVNFADVTKGGSVTMKQNRVKFDGKMNGHLVGAFLSYSAVGYMPKSKLPTPALLSAKAHSSTSPPLTGGSNIQSPGFKKTPHTLSSVFSRSLISPASSRMMGPSSRAGGLGGDVTARTLDSSNESVATSISQSVLDARKAQSLKAQVDGPQTNMLTRTMPKRMCRVGPSSTFRSHNSKELDKRRDVLSERYRTEKERTLAHSQKGKSKLVSELRKVVHEQDQVMNGGIENVSRFCLDLLQSKYSKRNRQDDTSTNAQERALVWHHNLDVRLAPSERVLHAMHRMNAARKAEMRRTNTTAKSLLTNKRIY